MIEPMSTLNSDAQMQSTLALDFDTQTQSTSTLGFDTVGIGIKVRRYGNIKEVAREWMFAN